MLLKAPRGHMSCALPHIITVWKIEHRPNCFMVDACRSTSRSTDVLVNNVGLSVRKNEGRWGDSTTQRLILSARLSVFFLGLHVCLSVCLSVCLFCLSVCPIICVPVCLPVPLHVCLVRLSTCMCVRVSRTTRYCLCQVVT